MPRRMMRITGTAAAGLGALALVSSPGTPGAEGSVAAPAAYVASAGPGTVTRTDTKTGAVRKAISAGAYSCDIALTPDGTMAYVVALEKTPRMAGIVVPISTLTGAAGRVIRVGNEPLSVAFTP